MHLGYRFGIGARELAPRRADNADVAEQHPVHLDLRNAAAGKTDNHKTPLRRQNPDRVVERIPAYRIYHDLSADAVGQFPNPLSPSRSQRDNLVGTELTQEVLDAFASYHGDHPSAVRLGQLDGCRSDSARSAEHDDRLPRDDLRATSQRELHRLIVDDQRGRLVEGESVRNSEYLRRVDGNPLCIAAQIRGRENTIARSETRPFRRGDHDARDLRAGNERRFRADLILAVGDE